MTNLCKKFNNKSYLPYYTFIIMSLSGAAIKELDKISCSEFLRWSKDIDLPERVHLIELYEKRLEVLD
jgi:hypothetical protein